LPASTARPSSTWLPRTDPRETVQQTEVLFHDAHGLADCVGPTLAQAHQELPDLRLFVEPGGGSSSRTRSSGAIHAHLPAARSGSRPASRASRSISRGTRAEMPESIAFVSPAQEIRAGDGEARTSYALPDSVFAAIKPLSAAEGLLAVQPFAGGRPTSTPNGTMWAFTLPRNSRQFFVYLLDPSRNHGDILKGSYVGFGETILAADLIVDRGRRGWIDDRADPGRALPPIRSARTAPPGALVVYAGPAEGSDGDRLPRRCRRGRPCSCRRRRRR
jgi:hypothetical protein